MPLRTTVRLEESLLEQAKAEAARRNKTLTALIEEGLRLALVNPRTPVRRKKASLPVSRQTGGTRAGVDINNSAGLLDILEGRH
ncbi:MAG: DUF2191 domain-containing protein [Bryobacteraceae bacterium]|jgi:hypothetical protein